jgi:hypothetical protein
MSAPIHAGRSREPCTRPGSAVDSRRCRAGRPVDAAAGEPAAMPAAVVTPAVSPRTRIQMAARPRLAITPDDHRLSDLPGSVGSSPLGAVQRAAGEAVRAPFRPTADGWILGERGDSKDSARGNGLPDCSIQQRPSRAHGVPTTPSCLPQTPARAFVACRPMVAPSIAHDIGARRAGPHGRVAARRTGRLFTILAGGLDRTQVALLDLRTRQHRCDEGRVATRSCQATSCFGRNTCAVRLTAMSGVLGSAETVVETCPPVAGSANATA